MKNENKWFTLDEKLPSINKEVLVKYKELTLIGMLKISIHRSSAYFDLPYNSKTLLLKEVESWAKIPKNFFNPTAGA